jgi:hypothetical protein
MAKFQQSRTQSGVRLLTAIATLALALSGSTYEATSQDAVLPASAQAMTASEVHELFSNKSWKWENGAGRMKAEGRRFSAWVDGENDKSWAEGRWLVTKTGQMCLDATWHSASGGFPARTCFSHMVDGGTIYQKREPDGKWFVFRHVSPQDGDEANTLLATDLVSGRLKDMKAAVGPTMQPSKE